MVVLREILETIAANYVKTDVSLLWTYLSTYAEAVSIPKKYLKLGITGTQGYCFYTWRRCSGNNVSKK